MNVSLPAALEQFVRSQVESGRYRSASEVVRDGLRLLEKGEQRRLLEKWVYEGLSEEEQGQLSPELMARARAHFEKIVDEGQRDIDAGRVVDGPVVIERLREALKARER